MLGGKPRTLAVCGRALAPLGGAERAEAGDSPAALLPPSCCSAGEERLKAVAGLTLSAGVASALVSGPCHCLVLCSACHAESIGSSMSASVRRQTILRCDAEEDCLVIGMRVTPDLGRRGTQPSPSA